MLDLLRSLTSLGMAPPLESLTSWIRHRSHLARIFTITKRLNNVTIHVKPSILSYYFNADFSAGSCREIWIMTTNPTFSRSPMTFLLLALASPKLWTLKAHILREAATFTMHIPKQHSRRIWHFIVYSGKIRKSRNNHNQLYRPLPNFSLGNIMLPSTCSYFVN